MACPAPPSIKSALLLIKDELDNPDAIKDWVPSSEPCGPPTWTGLTCSAPGLITGEQPPPSLKPSSGWSRVHTLVTASSSTPPLAGLNLTAATGPVALPDAIKGVTTLTDVQLGGGGYNGDLPSSWSTLTALTRLDLGPNQGVAGEGAVELRRGWTYEYALRIIP